MQPDFTKIKPILRKLKIISTATAPEDVTVSRPHHGYSFKIASRTPQSDSTSQPSSAADANVKKHNTYKEPQLPNLKPPGQRDANKKVCTIVLHPSSDAIIAANENPTLPKPEAVTDIATYQAQLHQVLSQIQSLYQEGPLIDGYLESYPATSQQTVTLSQNGVESIEYVKDAYNFASGNISCAPGSVYQLCGIDANGKKWSYPCPAAQLPSVSIAIARFQKLQQILKRKHHLETQLKQMSESSQPET